ncbi:3-oxoacyl-ACP synthase [Gelidibacter salicanalis]|uniref:3-oxoacyl-ACP synthase n=1 Tax=Gelidibacter salicanalis TaxID=291193 RepID=A0A934KSW8_9FLAO|nr:3-oxoacyl-ACP synthase [Gelidibacter salicanalis]MBJ7879533.1 3-oxoacyl-ACP synthase [Gelidibacter salicanalis]
MKSNSPLKQELYAQCVDFVKARYTNIHTQIREIQAALTSETKSSAGDKHETGRAMLQLEREKVGQQLAEIEKVMENLSKIDITKSTELVSLGSIVFTSQSNYFIAVSAGQFRVNSDSFYAISPNTPIGLALTGKKEGDQIIFRDQQFIIEAIE